MSKFTGVSFVINREEVSPGTGNFLDYTNSTKGSTLGQKNTTRSRYIGNFHASEEDKISVKFYFNSFFKVNVIVVFIL